MAESRQKAIGGYFELTLTASRLPLHADARLFQSARAAFHALLADGKPRRVWMPRYICDAMISPLTQAGITHEFYELDDNLGVASSLTIGKADWLLYVNYFGICTAQEAALSTRFDPSQIVFDRSQALFAKPINCLAEIYSPRKFFGLPDGGMLESSLSLPSPAEMDAGSIARCTHLLKRLDSTPEDGYADFQHAEQTLADTSPKQMSNLTKSLLRSQDHDDARRRRNENFRSLHERLKPLNELPIDVNAIDGPLCYPLLADGAVLRARLQAARVFVPTYWPEVTARSASGSIEVALTSRCLPLPCDQRYDQHDMARIADLLCP